MASDEPFPHVAQITGTGGPPDFSLAAPSGATAATTSPGQPAIYSLQLASVGGFNGTVAFTCSGAPKGAVCSALPNPVTLSGNAVPFAVTITTAAPSAELFDGRPRGTPLFASMLLSWSLPLLVTLLPVAPPVKRPSKIKNEGRGGLSIVDVPDRLWWRGSRRRQSPTPNSGTPPGTYPITLTATSGATTHTMTLSLTVQ